MTGRRALVASLLGFGLAGGARAQSAAPSPVWAALRTPSHFAMIRHALAPGTFDPPGYRLDDCSTQRNLSAEGRTQATRIGEMFRANGIAAAKLYSSQWCRCLETARLMTLGNVTPEARLNSFAQNRERAEGQMAALRPWLSALDLTQPTVLVTHQVVITALSGVFPGSGEIVVLSRNLNGDLTLHGRQPTD